MKKVQNQISGIIYDLKKFAIHDGPGIRTTVFLKGCPLDCWWCHNPESRDPLPQARGKLRPIKNLPLLQGSADFIGVRVTVEELMGELRKDVLFFDESEGGVTFSGGEPLLQPQFLKSALEACKAEGIHTVVDTTGFAAFDVIESLAASVDLFLYDLKLMDDRQHRKYTGVSNKRILDNLLQMQQAGYPIRIRIPMIPDITDTQENMQAIRAFLFKKTALRDVELLPYNSMGESKYDRLQIEFRPAKQRMQSESELKASRDLFRKKGFRVVE